LQFYHCIVLEGGLDEAGSFHHIPIKDTASITEVFRRRVIKLFVDKGLLDCPPAERYFALKILSWKASGFSVNNSVLIPTSSRKARVNLSQYIIRHPVPQVECFFVSQYRCFFKSRIIILPINYSSQLWHLWPSDLNTA